jgi:hypothetical protein
MQRKGAVELDGTVMDHWDHLRMMIQDGAMDMAERSSLEPMHSFPRYQRSNRDNLLADRDRH